MNTPIKGYEGLYEIDSDGNVWSLILPGRGAKNRTIPHKLPIGDNGHGYKRVSLSKKGTHKNYYIHRLVAQHFIPGKNIEVAHKNGDRDDNRIENLMWCSKKENESHKRLHGTLLYGSKAPWSKLTEQDVIQIRVEKRGGSMVKDIAERFKVCPTAISAILNGRNWKHVLIS